MAVKIANNATSRLASSISTGDTTISVQPGDGAKFPAPTAGDWFPITLIKADGQLEICRCTARAADVLTVLRGQEGTSAKSFAAGDRAELRLTAAAVDSIVVLAHGQCRFNVVSASECKLVPYNGNGLVINGKQYRIPQAGVSISNAGLLANTLYYVFAKDDGSGGIALEAALATVGRSLHTDGVMIKTGDPTRTLVGMFNTNTPAGFISFGTNKWVASWFNRIDNAMAETPVNSPTTSTSYVKLTNGLYPLMWAGDCADVNATGIVTTSVAAMGAYTILTANTAGFAGGHGYTLQNTGYQYPSAVCAPYIAPGDGVFNLALYGMSGSASAAITFRHDLNCRWPQ